MPYGRREEQETERIRKRRPFHRDCLREYQRQNRSGLTLGATVALPGLVVIVPAALYLLKSAAGRASTLARAVVKRY
jgi:hypothetical protein